MRNPEKRMTPVKVIRYWCLECCAERPSLVRMCEDRDCPSYQYRFGKNPKRKGIGNYNPVPCKKTRTQVQENTGRDAVAVASTGKAGKMSLSQKGLVVSLIGFALNALFMLSGIGGLLRELSRVTVIIGIVVAIIGLFIKKK